MKVARSLIPSAAVVCLLGGEPLRDNAGFGSRGANPEQMARICAYHPSELFEPLAEEM